MTLNINLFRDVVVSVNNALVTYSRSWTKSTATMDADRELETKVREVLDSEQVVPAISMAAMRALSYGPTQQGEGFPPTFYKAFYKATQQIAWDANQALVATLGSMIGPSGRAINLPEAYQNLTYSAVGSPPEAGIFNPSSRTRKEANLYSSIDILDLHARYRTRFEEHGISTVGGMIEWYLAGQRLKGISVETRNEIGETLNRYRLVLNYTPWSR